MRRLAAAPNGIDKLYAILTRNSIPFQKLPIGTLMIEAILAHEYPENCCRCQSARPSEGGSCR